MAKVNKKLEELNKTIEEVYFDPEETWKEMSYQAGENKAREEITKKMLKDNIDVDTIIKYTGLTKEEIENL